MKSWFWPRHTTGLSAELPLGKESECVPVGKNGSLPETTLAPPELVRELEANRQVVFRYAEACNGSVDDIAGVCNERGNVLGLMPHPEHAVDPLLGSADGALILASLVEAARKRVLALI